MHEQEQSGRQESAKEQQYSSRQCSKQTLQALNTYMLDSKRYSSPPIEPNSATLAPVACFQQRNKGNANNGAERLSGQVEQLEQTPMSLKSDSGCSEEPEEGGKGHEDIDDEDPLDENNVRIIDTMKGIINNKMSIFMRKNHQKKKLIL